MYRNNSFPSYPCYFNEQVNSVVDFPTSRNCNCEKKKHNIIETSSIIPSNQTNNEVIVKPQDYTKKQGNFKKQNYNDYNKPYKNYNKQYNKKYKHSNKKFVTDYGNVSSTLIPSAKVFVPSIKPSFPSILTPNVNLPSMNVPNTIVTNTEGPDVSVGLDDPSLLSLNHASTITSNTSNTKSISPTQKSHYQNEYGDYDDIDDLDYHTTDYVNNYVYKNFDNYPLNKKFNKSSIVCSNCRKKGHFQRQCKRPIRSYGIIALRSRGSEFEYLLIRRVHSIGFETFVRGRYNSQKELQALVDRMTSQEKIKVKTKTFDELWDDICVNKSTYFYKAGKKGACEKFSKVDVKGLFNDVSSPWLEPCWGFPKGRRQLHETEKECAIREFGEETDYRSNKYEIISRKPFIETYVGTNNIRYCHNYFIAFMDSNAPDAAINFKNADQIAEVGDIRWLKFEESSNIMKPYDVEKKAVLKAVNQFITSHYIPKDNIIVPKKPSIIKNI